MASVVNQYLSVCPCLVITFEGDICCDPFWNVVYLHRIRYLVAKEGTAELWFGAKTNPRGALDGVIPTNIEGNEGYRDRDCC